MLKCDIKKFDESYDYCINAVLKICKNGAWIEMFNLGKNNTKKKFKII